MIIYKLTNKIDGMKYIGQTVQKIEKRIRAHKCLKANKCPYLKNAIAKHGFDNFSVEILAKTNDKIELDKLEIQFIKSENSLYPNGYNLKIGGQQGGPWSQESRKKLSLSKMGSVPANKGKPGIPCTEEKKEYLSKLFAGRKPWNTGKKMLPCSEKTKEIRSILAKSRGYAGISKAINASKKPIYCNENGKTYSSFAEAEKDLKISRVSIRHIVNGKKKSVKGFSFKLLGK